MALIETSRGWRRLWPSSLQLRTVQVPGEGGAAGLWQWEIWDKGKCWRLACGAETYTRPGSAARGGVRFGAENLKVLEEMVERGVAAPLDAGAPPA